MLLSRKTDKVIPEAIHGRTPLRDVQYIRLLFTLFYAEF